MSFYDDPTTIYNARIASEKSNIVDLKYTYNKLVNIIVSSNPEDVSEDLIQQQLGIIQQIKDKKQNILILENELTKNQRIEFVPVPDPFPESSTTTDLSNNPM